MLTSYFTFLPVFIIYQILILFFISYAAVLKNSFLLINDIRGKKIAEKNYFPLLNNCFMLKPKPA